MNRLLVILLHGGMSYEMLIILFGSIICAIILFIAMIKIGFKSRYHREVIQNFEPGPRFLIYIIFISWSVLMAMGSFWVFMFLIGGIMSWAGLV